MLIEVTNTQCRVIHASPSEEAWLDYTLSFEQKAQKHGRGAVLGDGRTHLFSKARRSFPAGFIGSVMKFAAAESMKIELVERRGDPLAWDAAADTKWLRWYQAEALERSRTRERGVFWHATGAGKTEVIAALTLVRQCKWIILTHRKSLMIQTAERCSKRGVEDVGMVGDGVFEPGRVTVATFNTIHRGLHTARVKKLLAECQGMMIDECHVAPAQSFYSVAMACQNAYFRYGFSGTPFARGDDKSLYTWAVTGPIIHRVSAKTLIDEGVLSKPTIRMIPVVQDNLPRTRDWHAIYDAGIVNSRVRNAAVIAAARKAVKPCLVFVKAIPHGKKLEDALMAAGETVEFVWGKHETAKRQAAIRRLVHGDTDILICNVIFQEGIDIPELQSIVIAAGGKSTIAVLQDVGRGTRKHAEDGSVTKEAFTVYDIADRGHSTLAAHARERVKAYGVEAYDVVEERNLIS